MKLGRPKDGFIVRLAPIVEQSIASNTGTWPRLPDLVRGIAARLKMTGHRDEETRQVGDKWNKRLFVARGELVLGIPTIAVRYTIQADVLLIDKILITNNSN